MSVPTPILQYTLSDATMKGLLPAGYTPLAYIESSGTLYIDTGVLPDPSTTDYLLDFLSVPGDYVYLGASISNWETAFCISSGGNSGGNTTYYILHNGAKSVCSLNGTARHFFCYFGTTANYDGNNKSISRTSLTINKNIYLFANNSNGSVGFKPPSMKCYSCRIWSGGSLVLDLRPARRDSDGVIGMYDLVSRTFKTNSGSGSFIAGPELAVGKGGGKSLPEEYLLVEYLESTGTQYISTSYSPSSNVTIKSECSLAITKNLSDNAIWGSYNTSSRVRSYPICIYNNKPFYGNSTGNIGLNSGSVSQLTIGTFYTLCTTSGPSSSNMLVNGNLILSNSASASIVNNCRYAIFGRYHSTNMSDGSVLYISSIKLQWLKHYEDNVIKFSFIPCYRKSDMKPGMYDTVNGVFYTNAGSGEFILGPTITNCYTWEPNCKSPNFCIGYNQGQEVTLNTYNSTGSFTQFLNNLFAITDYSLTVNRTYTVSFDAISPNGTSELLLYNANSTPRYFYYSKSLGNVTTSWQHYSYTFTSLDRGSGNAVSHPVEIYAPSKTGVKIRNLSIYEGSIDWSTATNRNGLYTNVSGAYDTTKGWVASGSDTSASYIEFDKSIINTLMTAKTFSIAFWFRVHNTNRHILFGSNSNYPLNIEYYPGPVMRYYFASSPDKTGSTTIATNTWYHVALCVTSSGFTAYINGNVDATYTSAPTFNQFTGNCRIGSDTRDTSIYLGADISNFMIFDTALTAAQVKELYGK